jgi:hypothetical protein
MVVKVLCKVEMGNSVPKLCTEIPWGTVMKSQEHADYFNLP